MNRESLLILKISLMHIVMDLNFTLYKLLFITMAKHQINYSRIAPDHRVPFDYTFVKKTQNPM